MKRVAAIDGGYRNLALCVINGNNMRDPHEWRVFDLWKRKPGRSTVPTRDDLVRKAVKWCRTHSQLLNECDAIVLENQIREKFVVINTVIQALFFDKCKVVHPMTVGAFFKLPVTRAQKKEAGVHVVLSNGAIFPRNRGKFDDLADAWMMAVHELCLQKQIDKQVLHLNK